VFHEGEEGAKFYIVLGGSCAVVAKSQFEELKQLAVLRPGECFGELALIANMPRAAGVVCREDAHLAVLDKNEYSRILAKEHEYQMRNKVELLQRHPIFARWTKGALQRLSYFFKLRLFKRKQTLFAASTLATEVFIVKSGDFRLLLRDETSWKRTIEVALVTAGEILGASELLEQRQFAYNCVCSSAVGEVLVITKEDFLHAVSEDTTESLLRVERDKEKHRAERRTAALRLQGNKPKLSRYPSEPSLLDASTSLLLKKELVRGKVAYEPLPATLDSPSKGLPMRLGNFSVRNPRTPKQVHLPASHSWSDIFLSKYSLHPAQHKKHPISIDFLSTREVKPQLRRLQEVKRVTSKAGLVLLGTKQAW